MPKTLWIVNHYAKDPSNPGGTRHFSLAKYIKPHGWETTLITSSIPSPKHNQFIPHAHHCQTVQEVNFLRLSTLSYSKNDIFRLLNMLHFAKKALKTPKYLEKKPDCIIGSTIHPFAALSGYILAKRLKVPFIYEVRDLWPKTLIDMKAFSPRHPLCLIFQWIEKTLAIRASHIISVLPYANEYFHKYAISSEKITWIPNGIDFEYTSPSLLKENDEFFNVYYLGAHGRANNLDNLLDAMSLLKDSHPFIRLHCIGDGPEKKRLEARALTEGLANVIFHPAIAKNKLPEYYKKANAFIFNLKKLDVFKFGISANKLFDYMAAARPIIFCCNAKNNLIAKSNSGLSVEAENPNALANALIYLAEMPYEKKQNMGQQALDYVKKHHDYKNLSSQLLDILNTLSPSAHIT